MGSQKPVSPKRKQAPHSGHRKRKKDFVLHKGAHKLDDTELLEMLLYYALPRVDTKPHAEKLLEKFGSLEGVLSANKGEISQIDGLRDGAEVLFALLQETFARIGGKRTEPSLLEPKRLKEYLVGLYLDMPIEAVYALYFTKEGKLVGKQLVFRGKVNSVRFSLRTITEGIIQSGGYYVVLAHNHPSGSVVPSTDDIITTKRIAAHLSANDIELYEHFIVAGEQCEGILRVNL